ncbi:aldehyde dehydrogenase family protein [Microbacterium karelineae]|uniref:aldehyde dehydrogenase family protein n=1 Tax=Microbacterium karelineae TaxID=2654283 RepID=UPI0012EAD0C4|nr:aldehyde dehydrogenase family protein [Microbacterium karelineae]
MENADTIVAGEVLRADTESFDVAQLPPGQHFIAGEFTTGSGEEAAVVVDPSRGEVICEVVRGTAEDVDAAVAAARDASAAWRKLTPQARAEALLAVADRMQEHAELLMALESLNTGKPRDVAEDDVSSAIDCFRFAAGAQRAGTALAAGEYVEDHLSVIHREPLGVIGAVTPWNYPLLMGVWKIAPILAAGNTLVLKASETTPLSTLKLAELTSDILPAGVFNVVNGRGTVIGTRLAEHPDVAMIALTGSVGSGRAVARVAAESVKRVHLELGGKAPAVVFADADLAGAAKALRTGGFWNAGQECGAACRVLVDESVAEEFTRILVDEISEIVVGEAGTAAELGPMISRDHFERVLDHLARAKEDGVRVALGGGALAGRGFFVAPTILVDVPVGAACTQEEIFGPVVTIETFASEDEAVDRANEVPFGLAASLFTENTRRSNDVAARLDAGTVWVNDHLVISNEMPWGGFKGSGYGRDLSAYALDDYSRTKHVMHSTAR